MKIHFPLFVALSGRLTAAQIFCIQGITTTIAYEAALNPKGTSCPVNEAQGISYYLANSAGCCTSTATVKTQDAQSDACCPCGALCTGGFPPMLNWAFDPADQLLLTPTSGSGTVFTVTPNAPRSGSATRSISDTMAASTTQQISTARPTSDSSASTSSTSSAAVATASSSSAIAHLTIWTLKARYWAIILLFVAFMKSW